MGVKMTRAEGRIAARGDLLRTVVFKDVFGVRHCLRLRDSGRLDNRGCSYLAYELSTGFGATHQVVFEGEDFAGSPLHADDSDATVKSILSFLTLRPGDTDADYFASYTPEQIAWRDAYAEELGSQALSRFGEG